MVAIHMVAQGAPVIAAPRKQAETNAIDSISQTSPVSVTVINQVSQPHRTNLVTFSPGEMATASTVIFKNVVNNRWAKWFREICIIRKTNDGGNEERTINIRDFLDGIGNARTNDVPLLDGDTVIFQNRSKPIK